jgi:5-dehydro-4-deoxyglucarate dehydratase
MLPPGLLSFPLTAFDDDGELDLTAFRAHLEDQIAAGPAAVFVACGTGEYSALSEHEHAQVARAAVETAAGRVPVFVGIGGGVGTARANAAAVAEAGADGALLLPPYLVTGPDDGLLAHVRAVASASSVPLLVYRRGTAVFGADAAVALLDIPSVIGIKDGVGDVDRMTRIITAVRNSGHAKAEEFTFLNGLPTAELSALAYRGLGVPQYSSAVFCFAPDIALAFSRALMAGDDAACRDLLHTFYLPYAALRDHVLGYHVALVKAGARWRGRDRGFDVGRVRPPLVDADTEDISVLIGLIQTTRTLLHTQEDVA